MVLSPHIEENGLHIRSGGDRLDIGLRFAIRQLLGHRRWELAGVVFREILEVQDGEVRGLWLRRARILFYPVVDDALMTLGPVSYSLGVRRISAHPSLRQLVVIISPLRDEMRLSLELILLKPSLDVGSNQLAGLGTTLILHDRSQHPCDSVSQRVVGRRQGG